jgi:hypothetical protein
MAELCHSCNAPIRFVLLAPSGKRMPIDWEPHPEGNVMVLEDGKVVVLSKGLASTARANHEDLHRSHFATCTDPDRWRRRSR